MIESQDRVEQFRAEIADMKLRDPATSRERLWLGLASFLISHNSSDPLVQNDAVTLGLGGIVAALIGGALFLRFSIASFLRFWLARLIYEQKAQTDRLLEK